MRALILWAGILVLLASCQTTPTRSAKDQKELLSSLMNLTTTACKAGYFPGEDEKQLMDSLGKTTDGLCSCIFGSFFTDMTVSDLDGFLDDGKDAAEREPWKTRILKITLNCLGQSTA